MAKVRRPPEVPSLKLTDFSDRELLALARDLSNSDGWVLADTVADAIWPMRTIHEDDKEPYNPGRGSVAVRFSWMRRYGVMEYDKAQGWRLNDVGREFVDGTLSKRQEQVIMAMDETAMMQLGYTLADKYMMAGDVAATLFRRSMRYAQERRRWRS